MMRHDLPPKPLTPTMQQEVDAIVFKPRRSAAPSAAPAAAPSSPSGYLVAPLPAKPSYVHQARSLAHKHGEDHWSQMNMADGSDNSTPYDLVYSMAHATKDTDDHFGNGMNMAENNDTSMSFDRVYDSRFTHKDTEDHFDGMIMGTDDHMRQDEANRVRLLSDYRAAKASLEAKMNEPEQLHMGHEQGDVNDHFGQGMIMYDTTDAERAEGAPGTIDAPIEQVESLNTFERVFGQGPLPPPLNVDPETFSIGPPGLKGTTDKRVYPVLGKKDMLPPPRPKFLHGVNADGSKHVSAAMQAHLDSIAYGGGQQVNQSGWRSEVTTSVTPGFRDQSGLTARASTAAPMGGGGGGGGAQSARGDAPAPAGRFAWNSERIAHELVCKFDQFTRRREDHMRKLLWTFGSDPHFESDNKNAITVSPSNFNRVCDRFGLVCDEQQAHEIFKSHNLPSGGCNLYTLAKNFLDTNDGELTRKSNRSPGHLHFEPPKPQTAQKDPFKLARLPDNAWRDHRLTGAAAAPFATTLPPIGGAK